MIKVSIAIIHFGNISITKDCLDSIFVLNLDNIELKVLIINNDSKVVFPKIKKTNGIEFSVINNDENNGFSGGHNQGFRFAIKNNEDFHLVLNNDVIVDKNLIKELIKSFNKNKKAGIISPKIYFAKGYEFHKDRYKKEEMGKVIWYAGGIIDWDNLISKHRGVDQVDNGQFDKDEETEFATGACAMLSKDVLSSVKGFDEKYFLYYEDGDLNVRIKKRGYKAIYCARGFLWHRNAASSGSGSELQDYYITRNRMLFGFSHAPIRTKLALIRESFRIFINGRKWQKIGIRDFYMRKFGRGSYPI